MNKSLRQKTFRCQVIVFRYLPYQSLGNMVFDHKLSARPLLILMVLPCRRNSEMLTPCWRVRQRHLGKDLLAQLCEGAFQSRIMEEPLGILAIWEALELMLELFCRALSTKPWLLPSVPLKILDQ